MVLRPFIFISNKMKKVVLNFIIACIFSVITTTVRAQIVLHEVTDVSQTKATLSADFPDLSDEHGFQYKYGTLPEIDNFLLVSDKNSILPKKIGLIPFAGVSPFWLF